MGEAKSFFIMKAECDPGYGNVRDKSRYAAYKNFIEGMGKIYKPYADRHFQRDAALHFEERFWEMYLGATFLEHGFTLNKDGAKGPEFYLSNTPKKIWIEAIAPGPGIGSDAYKLPKQQGGSPIAFTVPIDKIILRLRSAIEEKKGKYEKYADDGIIGPDDIYIIAINSKRIDTIVLSAGLPNIVRSVYPFGDLQVIVDRETLKTKETKYAYKDAIKKENGSPVSTSIFLDDAYAGISAVIYSDVNCANKPEAFGADFVLVHNMRAVNKLNLGTFKFGSEYWIEGDMLKWKNWNE